VSKEKMVHVGGVNVNLPIITPKMYSKIPAVAAGSLVAMVCGGLWYLKLLV
jgi:hypothetical protein